MKKSRYTPENGRYTVTDIADRFEEAAYTLRRLPPVKVQGYQNTWPEIIRDVFEKMQEEKLSGRLGPPAPDAISRMEETIGWVFWLDEDDRRLVWLRAERVKWKLICQRIGCCRAAAHYKYRVAIMKIVTRLNAIDGGCKNV